MELHDQILDLPEKEAVSLAPAGFRKRAAAFVIDLTILFLLQLLVGPYLHKHIGVTFSLRILGLEFTGPYFLFSIAYFSILESSGFQATPGKMLLGLKVGDKRGNKISLLNALGRCLSSYLSGVIFFIGYMMVIWTTNKQALHDKLAGTYVFTTESGQSDHTS